MGNEEQKISGIKKVSLTIKAGNKPDEMNLIKDPVSVDFIYGIGTYGLSPFEKVLTDRSKGEDLSIHIESGKTGEFFNHIHPALDELTDDADNIFFRIRIININEADHREVIKAMSERTGCGDDCCGH